MKSIHYLTIPAMMLLFACKASQSPVLKAEARAPVIVYKTKADYSDKVPIVLNEAGDRILAYPAPTDLQFEDGPATPLKLKKGYLLDRRGIQPNSAFTSFTYEEYAALESAPQVLELLERVIDKDPFTEMYLCGKHGQFEDLKKELNLLIGKDFEGCEDLLK